MRATEIKSIVAQLPDHLQEWLAGRNPEEIEAVVPDMVGIGRGKAMPGRKFASEQTMFLPTSIFFQTITGGYADVAIANAWAESDLVLVPDLSTARAVPWTSDVTIQVICDVHTQDGKLSGLAPRNVLKRVLDLYSARGWKPVVAPEMEFYLTKPNVDPDLPIVPPIGRSGRQGVGRQAYSISGVDEYSAVVDDIYDFAEAQGLEIDTVMQEGGAGQLEINLNHGDPLKLADQVFMFKRTIREAALRHDCYATFMAKPMENEPGSAMHVHQSVVDIETGASVFNDQNDQATELFHGFLAGQQTYLNSVVCLLAPYVNSYRRLVPGESAPINLEWGTDNRSTGLRIPISKPGSRRVECRVVGMDANPYLAMAACLACGYLGMVEKLKPRKPIVSDAGDLPHELPHDVKEALKAFENAPKVQELLGVEFSQLYIAIKRSEQNDFLRVISPWEREHLLLNV
ncbi:glutamine synthetase family protein [Falsihalocynthiibacter sp. S25ZX9]|uniref:glutamine synthetase family protein n=1 Tax=Falsihalocynthiibacter sp. S25ZX9 TaxID=3240870 RepID=UPI00350F74C6